MTSPSLSAQAMAWRSTSALHQRLGFLGQGPQVAGVLRPQPGLQIGLVLAQAGVDLAAIAARGAEADRLGFDQDRLCAGLGQMQRGRQARIAAADDADVGRHAARSGAERAGAGPALAA